MRKFSRVVISVVVGFLLMGPLGYVYGVLHWPTFHSWGLLHGGLFSAWPTLSIITFLALGYVPLFPRVEDTPLLIFGLAWGLLATGFLGISSYLSPSGTYGWLAGTAAIVMTLSFFARFKLRLALLVVLPIVLHPTSPPAKIEFLFSALIGWGLGSLASAILRPLHAAGQSFPSHLVALGEEVGRSLGVRRD